MYIVSWEEQEQSWDCCGVCVRRNRIPLGALQGRRNMNFLLLLLYCCHRHPCYHLQSRASKEDATSWESNQSWIQTEYSKSIWSTEVGEGKRQSEARIRFRRNGTREWSEGGDSSMILRALYWGTRLCRCMECMVKNARQGIDQSHVSRSNIHRTFLWSVNKPRVPFPSLPRVFNSVPQRFPTLPSTPKEALG